MLASTMQTHLVLRHIKLILTRMPRVIGLGTSYSDMKTPPPVFMDKFYNALPPVASRYDIDVDNLDITNMTKTDYYYAVTVEQTRATTASSLTNGLKGPIEFILGSKSDPEQTVHYWSTDNWQTTNEFIDKQQEGRTCIRYITYSSSKLFRWSSYSSSSFERKG